MRGAPAGHRCWLGSAPCPPAPPLFLPSGGMRSQCVPPRAGLAPGRLTCWRPSAGVFDRTARRGSYATVRDLGRPLRTGLGSEPPATWWQAVHVGGVDRTALTRVNRRGLSLGPRGRWWGASVVVAAAVARGVVASSGGVALVGECSLRHHVFASDLYLLLYWCLPVAVQGGGSVLLTEAVCNSPMLRPLQPACLLVCARGVTCPHTSSTRVCVCAWCVWVSNNQGRHFGGL